MRKLLAAMILVCLPACGMSPKTKRRLTLAALVAAQALDLHSSMGRREGNPLLRGANGRFDACRGVTLKLGILAGLITAQKVKPDASWNWVNLSYAGATTAIAIHNYRTAAPPAYIGPGR